MHRLAASRYALLVLVAGCSHELDAGPPVPPYVDPCYYIPTTGDVITKKPDGTLDTTAHDVWPDRADEGPTLSAEEVIGACARYAGCRFPDDADKRLGYTLGCADYGGIYEFGWNYEERAVVSPGGARWAVQVREVLASPSCDDVLGRIIVPPDDSGDDDAATPACEEDGCLIICVDPTTFSCQGTIAFSTDKDGKTHQRDCARSLADCDATSPTGCTDRTPRSCVHPATDACDGNVRLGCDGKGYVSFHDCARIPGATCQTIDGVGTCVAPESYECDETSSDMPFACDGDTATYCYQGKKVAVACPTIGLTTCDGGTCR